MPYLRVLVVLVVASYACADLAHADLITAAEKGDLEAVRKALDAGADPNQLPEETWGAVHVATLGGHTDVVALLVKRGAEVNLRQFGVTPLLLAIDRGHEGVIRVLLEAGADVEARDSAFAHPIHKAAAKNNLALVELLLKHGAKLEAVDRYGRTALAIAVSEGHAPLVQALLQRKADVDARLKDGRRPLHIAIREGHDAIAALLLGAGATQDMLTASALGDLDQVKKLLARGASIEFLMAWNETTPLMWAARAGQAPIVKHLVLNRARVGALDKWKGTALHYAARSGSVDAVRILLDHGGRIDAKTTLGTTPVLDAAKAGHGPVIALLAKRGANVNVAHLSEGLSALYEAAFGGHVAAVRALLVAGADVTRMTGTGRSAMHAGVASPAILELLLDAGAKVDVTNRRMRTPLHDACQEAYLDSVKLLLAKGASVEAADDRRLTPLHAVAMKSLVEAMIDGWDANRKTKAKKDEAKLKRRGEIAAALLAAGADPLAKDARGMTPLALAKENEFEAVIAVLEKALELR